MRNRTLVATLALTLAASAWLGSPSRAHACGAGISISPAAALVILAVVATPPIVDTAFAIHDIVHAANDEVPGHAASVAEALICTPQALLFGWGASAAVGHDNDVALGLLVGAAVTGALAIHGIYEIGAYPDGPPPPKRRIETKPDRDEFSLRLSVSPTVVAERGHLTSGLAAVGRF